MDPLRHATLICKAFPENILSYQQSNLPLNAPRPGNHTAIWASQYLRYLHFPVGVGVWLAMQLAMAGWLLVILSYGLLIGFVLAWAVPFAAVVYVVAYVMLMALFWLYERKPIRRLLIPWVSRLINTRRSDQQRA